MAYIGCNGVFRIASWEAGFGGGRSQTSFLPLSWFRPVIPEIAPNPQLAEVWPLF